VNGEAPQMNLLTLRVRGYVREGRPATVGASDAYRAIRADRKWRSGWTENGGNLRRAHIEQVVTGAPFVPNNFIPIDLAHDDFRRGCLSRQTRIADHRQLAKRRPPLTGPQCQPRNAVAERAIMRRRAKGTRIP
jgi:hypothetical protein